MFDLRRPIKIFVANGEVRYGPRVDNGFFPIFSVELIEEAKLLTEIVPWACTDSLTSYANRLEKMFRKTLTEKYEAARRMGLPNSGDLARDAEAKKQQEVDSVSDDLANALQNPLAARAGDSGPSPIAQAIMAHEVNEDE